MKRSPDEPDNKAARRLAELLKARGIEPVDGETPQDESPDHEPDLPDNPDSPPKPNSDHERTI
ncbi:hypothetical protein [uncultured Fibrella sp.]|uniref:hypothetical protein n=1 Tax=uncultured Fibrella sp. TaxID=1284596 RepID=UPI0035CAEF77